MEPGAIETACIAIVDDLAADVRVLERILGAAGFTNLRTFTDPAAALRSFEAEEPDLVMLDLHMPDVDGFAVLAELTARRSGEGYLPVLILTADPNAALRERALATGASDFLTKPFDRTEVVLRCRNLVETRLLHRSLQARGERLATEVRERSVEAEILALERTAVAEALERLAPGATPEASAAAVCAELLRLGSFGSAAVILFEPAAPALVLAIAGRLVSVIRDGDPLPTSRSRYLRDRAETGPWVEQWTARREDGAYGRQFTRAGVTGTLYAPLRHEGKMFGMLAAARHGPASLRELTSQLPAVVEFAALGSVLLGPAMAARRESSASRLAISRVIEARSLRTVFQPIVELDGGEVAGYEALTRFADGMAPDLRFADAVAVGLGAELELACLGSALEAAAQLPRGTWLSLNVSPGLVLERRRLAAAVRRADRPIVLELTEHVPIADYDALRAALARLGRVRVAVDDAGAGFASFSHVLELRPDFVKLDRTIVHGIEGDPGRRAFVAGMRHFADQTGCSLVAEGVETARERRTLRELGVALGQGHLFQRPAPVTRLLRRPSAAAAMA